MLSYLSIRSRFLYSGIVPHKRRGKAREMAYTLCYVETCLRRQSNLKIIATNIKSKMVLMARFGVSSSFQTYLLSGFCVSVCIYICCSECWNVKIQRIECVSLSKRMGFIRGKSRRRYEPSSSRMNRPIGEHSRIGKNWANSKISPLSRISIVQYVNLIKHVISITVDTVAISSRISNAVCKQMPRIRRIVNGIQAKWSSLNLNVCENSPIVAEQRAEWHDKKMAALLGVWRMWMVNLYQMIQGLYLTVLPSRFIA